RVLAPPVNFGVPFLPAEAFNFGDGHPFDAKLGQRFFDLFELERFNDGFQLFHVGVNSVSRGALQPAFAAVRRGRSKAMCSTRSHSNNMKAMQASFSCPLKNVEPLNR